MMSPPGAAFAAITASRSEQSFGSPEPGAGSSVLVTVNAPLATTASVGSSVASATAPARTAPTLDELRMHDPLPRAVQAVASIQSRTAGAVPVRDVGQTSESHP